MADARTRPLAAPTLKVQSGRNGSPELTERVVCWVLSDTVSKVVTITIADEMAEMAGFRNVLAHEYADIVDERVYDHLQDIERFERYGSAIYDFLNDQ